MNRTYLLILLFTALILSTTAYGDGSNPTASDAAQTMHLLDEVVVKGSENLRSMRIMEIDTPVFIRGTDDDQVTVKLWSVKTGTAEMNLRYEIVGGEVWLSLRKPVGELGAVKNTALLVTDDASSSLEELLLDWDLEDLEVEFVAEITMPKSMNVVLGDAVMRAAITGVAGVDMKAGQGDFTLADITGFVRVRNNAGSLKLKNITGDVWISDKGGAISVENVTGLVTIDSDFDVALRIQDVTGDVTIASKLGGSAEVANVRGNVSVFSREPIKTACIGITGKLIVPENF